MSDGHVLYYGGKTGLFVVAVFFVLGVIFIWGNFISCYFQSNDKWVYAFNRNIFVFKFYILLFFYIKIFFSLITTYFTDTRNNLFSFSFLLHY